MGTTQATRAKPANPEECEIPAPEAEAWRVTVQETRATGEVMTSDLESAMPMPAASAS